MFFLGNTWGRIGRSDVIPRQRFNTSLIFSRRCGIVLAKLSVTVAAGADNQVVAHGLALTPALVYIVEKDEGVGLKKALRNMCMTAVGAAITTTTTKVKTTAAALYSVTGKMAEKAATDNFWDLTGFNCTNRMYSVIAAIALLLTALLGCAQKQPEVENTQIQEELSQVRQQLAHVQEKSTKANEVIGERSVPGVLAEIHYVDKVDVLRVPDVQIQYIWEEKASKASGVLIVPFLLYEIDLPGVKSTHKIHLSEIKEIRDFPPNRSSGDPVTIELNDGTIVKSNLYLLNEKTMDILLKHLDAPPPGSCIFSGPNLVDTAKIDKEDKVVSDVDIYLSPKHRSYTLGIESIQFIKPDIGD